MNVARDNLKLDEEKKFEEEDDNVDFSMRCIKYLKS